MGDINGSYNYIYQPGGLCWEKLGTDGTVDRHARLRYKGYIAKKMTREFHTRPKLSSCV